MVIATEKWAQGLKVLGRVFAVVVMLFGALFLFFGIIGAGPDGIISATSRLSAIFGGVINLALGVVYWLPNEKLEPYRKLYLALTLYLPIVAYLGVAVLLIYTFISDSSFRAEAPVFLAGYLALIVLSFSSPVSFLLHQKRKV